MSTVRKTIISNCEKKFVVNNIRESIRLDGRSLNDFRKIEIEFSKDWGCCCVSLGKTRVLAQVTCEIQEPKSSRPSEGILNINVELNPIAASHFESGRQSELSVQLNRLLEKCLKDSKAVDLESLCIKMNEKVWSLKVDINVLNHEGNILDCASVAALSALTHFRRPDVTCDGEEFIIHSYKQRDPIPTVIHHYPVCITYSVFDGGNVIVADPDLLEESIADGFLSIGLNSYKELCGLHLGGKVDLCIDVILSAANKAANRAGVVVQLIKDAVEKDNLRRQEKSESSFHSFINIITSHQSSLICVDDWKSINKLQKKKQVKEKETNVPHNITPKHVTTSIGKYSAVLSENRAGNNSKILLSSDSEEDIIVIDTKKSAVDILTIEDSESEQGI